MEKSLLIVDNDRPLIKKILAEHDGKIKASLVPTAEELKKTIASPNACFSTVVLNPVLAKSNGIAAIRQIRQKCPVVPIILIYDGSEPPFSSEELHRLTVHGSISKTGLTVNKIVELVNPLNNQPITLGQQVEEEGGLDDSRFLDVPVDQFQPNAKVFFDFYLKLSSGRYLRIIQAGEVFNQDRLKRYSNNGVKNLYFKKASRERYLIYCDRLSTFLVRHPSISMQCKVNSTMSRGEEMSSEFRGREKLEQVHLDYAVMFVAEIHSLIKQIDPHKREDIDKLLTNISAYEKAISTTLVSSLVAMPLQLETNRIVEFLGIAAFFHDVGLYSLPRELHHGSEAKMSELQRALYRTHPVKSVDILKTLDFIHPTILQAVLQHHERRNGKGFPHNVRPGEIHRLAEIIGISDEFVQRLQAGMIFPSKEILEDMRAKVYDGFSAPVINAFESVFFPPGRI